MAIYCCFPALSFVNETLLVHLILHSTIGTYMLKVSSVLKITYRPSFIELFSVFLASVLFCLSPIFIRGFYFGFLYSYCFFSSYFVSLPSVFLGFMQQVPIFESVSLTRSLCLDWLLNISIEILLFSESRFYNVSNFCISIPFGHFKL